MKKSSVPLKEDWVKKDPSLSTPLKKYFKILIQPLRHLSRCLAHLLIRSAHVALISGGTFQLTASLAVAGMSSSQKHHSHLFETYGSVPHLDLEMTGDEYQALLDQQALRAESLFQEPIFDDIFAAGKRNLDWIRVLNKNRPDPISLSTPETQQGFPLHSPRIYNPKIIRAEYQKLQQEMPKALSEVIFGRGPLPTQLPVPVKDYIYWGLQMDRAYQIAARWRTLEPYMEQLKRNNVNDLRGYYFLTNTPGFPEQLKNWNQINTEMQTQVTLWLNHVCRNNLRSTSRCQTLVQNAIKQNQAFEFFSEHRSASERILNAMMNIPANGKFPKTHWMDNNHFQVPFVDPVTPSMRSYLADNIQLEWKLLPFFLEVQWVDRGQYGVEVIWSSGVTPHVPFLGSNQIFMDANSPISEYDVQWTIRHEFGHVLGFPDCYLEFYDNELQAIVGYQIDTSDLMCSRQGHLKDRHVQELKRAYR